MGKILLGTGEQPINMRFNAERMLGRSPDELLGLCKGVIVDGSVNKNEAQYILQWLQSNDMALNEWAGSIIAQRVATRRQGGIIDTEESADLYATTHGRNRR